MKGEAERGRGEGIDKGKEDKQEKAERRGGVLNECQMLRSKERREEGGSRLRIKHCID